jgi:GAF domain-containing protein
MALMQTAGRRLATKQPRLNRDTASPLGEAVAKARDLARAGQHSKVIEHCSHALATTRRESGSIAAEQMQLLDLRAESCIALGQLNRAADDAALMIELAGRAKAPALKAQALNRKAIVQMRQGDLKQAVDTASAALKAARQSKQKLLVADSLLCLAEAQVRAGNHERGLETARRACAAFEGAGGLAGAGRAQWVAGFASKLLGRARESRRAAERGLELCQRAGDHYGVGNALNILSQTDSDIAESIQHLQRSSRAFELAGYVERRMVALGNLAIVYTELGLYRHACRLHREMVEACRGMGAKLGLTYALGNLIDTQIESRELEEARLQLRQFANLVQELGDPIQHQALPGYFGDLALAEGNSAEAAKQYESGAQIAHGYAGLNEITLLTKLAEANLASGDAATALKATFKATALHRAKGFPKPDSFPSQEIWWRHAQALSAGKRPKEAQQALERAYDFLLERVANLRDEGLRRNYLNKVEVNREIIAAWLEHGTKRKLPKKRAFAHLAIESNVREPFQRLADTGLRLNALHTGPAIQSFLVEEATELSGGERVLLVLERDGKREVVHSLLPPGEDVEKLLRDIENQLSSARLTRTADLVYTPETAPAVQQRSRIVAPLVAQNNLLGYLYVDMDGVYGRFDETDRDMMGLLANQAAVALDNAQWSQGLEKKVEERTTELTASNASLEQRNAELAIINSIQSGLASQLDFRAIVDLVGDKLREVFGGIDLGITWYDDKSNLLHYLYVYEHGKRLPGITRRPNPGGLFETRTLKRLPTVFRCLDDYKRGGIAGPIPGTDQSLSMVSVPIVGSDRVIGDISLENYERENAYGEADLRLLSTVAASMGVALENARLFDETQRLLKETEQRNAELAIINSIQQGLAAELNFQAIVDLVGDKLREVFKAPDLGVRWYDEKANLVHYLYEY